MTYWIHWNAFRFKNRRANVLGSLLSAVMATSLGAAVLAVVFQAYTGRDVLTLVKAKLA
jgi:hypothetical protein